MTGRKIGMIITTWQAIPWNRNCRECVSFASAPPSQHEQTPLLEAVWNHMFTTHHIEMLGDESLAKAQDKDRYTVIPYRKIVQ